MRHRYPTSPTLSTLRATFIYALVQRFCQSHPLPRTRGRPPLYPEALILTLSLLRTRDHASFRRLLYAIAPETLPDHALPALGTLVYRLHHISDARWQQLLGWLAQQGLALEGCTAETPYALVDGTGVGYALPFHAQYRRGREIRRLRSHVKVVGVGYWQGGRVWLVGVQLGKSYADEGRLLGEWVLQYGMGGLPRGTLLVGDKLYGYRARLLEQLEGGGWLPVMRVEDGLRQRVRSGSRLRARERAERYGEVLGGRYRIEQVFGSVKGVYGSYVGSVSWSGARSWVWGMWVLWNMVGVAQLGGEVLFWLVLCVVKGIFEHPQHFCGGWGEIFLKKRAQAGVCGHGFVSTLRVENKGGITLALVGQPMKLQVHPIPG